MAISTPDGTYKLSESARPQLHLKASVIIGFTYVEEEVEERKKNNVRRESGAK